MAERAVTLTTPGGDAVHGDLTVPSDAGGVVLFAHGSGSSRHSPRNRAVAEALQRRGLATMLVDLLTTSEEHADAVTGRYRFDIGLLSDRLDLVAQRLADDAATAGLPLGLFGASTGAAAALVTAGRLGDQVGAVVSRGGRPDLAGDALSDVTAPTLLIVGSRDHTVIQLNEAALERMRGEHDITIVEGASHLFEEPGTLDEVARLAGDWFVERLTIEKWA